MCEGYLVVMVMVVREKEVGELEDRLQEARASVDQLQQERTELISKVR